jgi:hypothetical protein
MVSKEMSCGGLWDGQTKPARMNGVPPSFFGYLKAELEEQFDNDMQYNKIACPVPKSTCLITLQHAK